MARNAPGLHPGETFEPAKAGSRLTLIVIGFRGRTFTSAKDSQGRYKQARATRHAFRTRGCFLLLSDDGGDAAAVAQIGHFDGSKSRSTQPIRILAEGIGVAGVGVDQHVESENEREWRSAALVIGNHVDNGEPPTRFQSCLQPAKQFSRGSLVFAMDDVSQ